MYIVGAIIFSVYMALTVWNIYNSNDDSKKD
jgi:hypothetical protein